MIRKSFALIVILFFGCSDEQTDPWEGFVAFISHYNIDTLSSSDLFASSGLSKGDVTLNEASGIVACRSNPSSLWAHNDSGNSNCIYLIDQSTAEIKATYRINGITNTDWEDIAIGPGTNAGENYVYLADIGDNTASRDHITIFVFPEPIFIEFHRGRIIDIFPKVETLDLTYPGGPRDAEAMMLDPGTKDIYVISKYGEHSILYVARYPQNRESSNALTEVGTFSFREAVAGDISSDGKEVLIKNYETIFYWQNSDNLPVWRLLSTEPLLAPYNPVEAQGEAICFTNEGYFTLSEKYMGVIPGLYFYKRH